MLKTMGVVLAGLVVGGWFAHEVPALLGAALAWVLWRQWQQQQAIAALERALAQRAPVAAADEAVAAPAPVQPAAEPPAPEMPAPEPVAPAPPSEGPEPAATTGLPVEQSMPVAEAVLPVAPAAPIEPAPPSIGDRAAAAIKAWLFGGNTIVKAGVAILFVGLAFLAKYASEHVQVPPELRLAGIGAVALAMLALGWRLRSSRPGYAQVVQGGAVAVLYLTLFVAFRWYAVIGVLPVFIAMVAVALLAAALAVLQDAMALAVVGAAGGFATPLLVSTGQGDPAALFGYYLVLDVGIVVVAWFRTWRLLTLVGFAGTYLVATTWGVLQYSADRYAMSQAFLVAYFVVFAIALVLPARRAAATAGIGARWMQGSLLFGLPTITFVLQVGLVKHTEYGAALSALALAAFYVGLAFAARTRPALAALFESALAIATVFVTLVIPFALDARSTAGAWALEGAGLVWLGFRQRRRLPRAFGYLLLALAGLAMAQGLSRHAPPAAVLNAVLINGLLAAAGSLIAACTVDRQRAALAVGEAIAEPLLIGWATLWLLGAAVFEIDRFVPHDLRFGAWLAVLAALAAGYAFAASRLNWRAIAMPALAHAPLMALALLLDVDSVSAPWQHGGSWGWPLALAAHVAVLRWALPQGPAQAARVVHAVGFIVLAGWGALAGRAVTADWGDADSAWRWLGWLAVPALALAALLRPPVWRLWPLRLDVRAYRGGAGAALALGMLAWALLANIVSNGSARPLPHLPLANPLDLGIAASLLAAWAWWRSDAAAALARQVPPAAGHALLGGLGFLWLNGMLVRAFHHWGGVPYHIDDWAASLAVQSGLALLWSLTALALMWWAARRGLRLPWLAGAGLLAVVVAKLLLVDLSGSGTVTRIVSFIGVGVLMLVIGYVAPLPSAKRVSDEG